MQRKRKEEYEKYERKVTEVYIVDKFMNSFLLDANIVIDILNLKKARIKRIKKVVETIHHANLYTCETVLSEIVAGIYPQKYTQKIKNYTDILIFLHSTKEIAESAGNLYHTLQQRGQKLPLADCTIASYSLYYKIPLITRDLDFKRFPGLEVIFISK